MCIRDRKRSNDFGYGNTSFYENEIGFTGTADITDSWRLIPQFEVNNESHGMYTNTSYSREEKDKIDFVLKNEYKPTPSRWDFNVGGVQYVHRLVGTNSFPPIPSIEKSFFKLNEVVGFEYIWSSSNKVMVKHAYSQYFYSSDALRDDIYTNNEIIFSLNLMEFLKVEPGFILDWDRDNDSLGGFFPSGRIDLSTIGLKYTLFEFSYSYDLVPFQPENLYLEQKYINPANNLLPGKNHHLVLKGEFTAEPEKSGDFQLRRIKLKAEGDIEKNSNYYNFYSLPNNVLDVRSVSVSSYLIKAGMVCDFRIFNNILKFDLNYEYSSYYSNENITYRPRHTFNGQVQFSAGRWEVLWSNRLIGDVYVEPDRETKLGKSVIGAFALQYRTFDVFSLYAKVNNIYNEEYSLRNGYPEPGITFLMGIKIVI